MSNRSLIERIEVSLSLLSRREVLAHIAADSFLLNGEALEALPYHLRLEMRNIGMDLSIADWEDEDGYAPCLGDVMRRAEDWLAEVSEILFSSDPETTST